MRITHDPEVDAVYVHLTGAELAPGRETVLTETLGDGVVNLDWKDGKLVGIEIIGARALLHPDLLAEATTL